MSRPPGLAPGFAARAAGRLAGAVALSLSVVFQAMAQDTPGNDTGLPAALAGIRQANSMCLREDVVAGPAAAVDNRRKPGAEPACALTPAGLAALQPDAGTVMVDVRIDRRERPPAGGAMLDMPLSALATKAFLRDKTVVLLGNGRAERELYEVCGGLRSQGYKRVHVLQGGVPHWLGSQPGSAPVAPPRLNAVELWAESQYDANLVLLLPAQRELKKQLPGAVDVDSLEPASIGAVVKRWRKAHKNAFLSAVVLVMGPDDKTDGLPRLQEALRPLPVLIYAETAASYVRQHATQKTIWAAQARGPKKPPCGL